MLNWVWLGLIVLGIGIAVSTDIFDQTTNKYRNGESISVQVQFDDTFQKDTEKIYDVTIHISAQTFNSFYNITTAEDMAIPARISFAKDKKETSVSITVDNNFPGIWQEMAKVTGKETDLIGLLTIKNFIDEQLADANIKFDDVSFLKMKEVTNSALDYAGIAVNIALGLIGIMALWLGVMKVAEEAGLIKIMARGVRPITKFLFPEVPPDHPAVGSMIMNISANMLGLGNAATPFGLKAMEELDKLNPEKGTATNAMCTFLAINTAGLTFIPAMAIASRAALGSSDPAIIIGTSMFAATCATVTGITAAKIFEKFPIKKGDFGDWLKQNLKGLSVLLMIAAAIVIVMLTGIGQVLSSLFSFLSVDFFKGIIQVISIIAIPLFIIVFVGYGAIKKVKVYEMFIEGAKEGFNVAVRIIPYLVAMLVAIGIFRAGGAMEFLIIILTPITNFIGMPAEALPMALMRPLSGSGSLGIMAEIIATHGPDSMIGILVSTFFGSTETTFYVLAVYFGAVNVKRTRHALPAGLLADIAGILGAVFIVRLLFG